VASYKIEVKKSALKELQKLERSVVVQILRGIRALSNNPRSQQSLKLRSSENSYRLRIGDYRIVYQIEDRTKTIIVYAVGHRKDIYRG
jgi:mRNA interferase RelE/StbE